MTKIENSRGVLLGKQASIHVSGIRKRKTSIPNRGRKLSSVSEARGGSGDTTYMDSASLTNENFDSRDTRIVDYRYNYINEGEPAFYDMREWEYIENEWYSFLIDTLVSYFLKFEIAGEGKTDVDNFILETQPDFLLEYRLALLSAVRDGTGFMMKIRDGTGHVKQFKTNSHMNYELTYVSKVPDEVATSREKKVDASAIDGEQRLIEIKQINDGTVSQNAITYFREYPRLVKEDYSNSKIALLRLIKGERHPHGQAIGLSCFHAVKALKQTNRGVMAALKKLTSLPLIYKMDLDAYGTAEEKKVETDAAATDIEDIDMEASSIIVLDQRNDLGQMGIIKEQNSGSDGRLIEAMKHLEPVLSAVLLNYLIPLGIVEQTGANKSIIARQMLDADRKIQQIQTFAAIDLKTQIFSEVTKKKIEILYPPWLEPEVITNIFTAGGISREELQKHLNVFDEGKTYVPLSTGPTGSPSSDGNNDDNPTKRKQESQSKAKQGVGS